MSYKRFETIVIVIFSIYLILVAIIDFDDGLVEKIFYYGFWLTLGILLGVSVSAYLKR